MLVKVRDLKPGDYVVPAKATVASVDVGGCLAIVDFTDKTATAPINPDARVEIERGNDD